MYQGLRVGVVELSSHGVHISESQTEALKQGISCLEKVISSLLSLCLSLSGDYRTNVDICEAFKVTLPTPA